MPAKEPLVAEFHKAMLNIYKKAKEESRYPASRFLRMIKKNGGLETARILLHAPKVSNGFIELCSRGRIDLTVEAEILKPKWKYLFSDHEREIAKNRLAKVKKRTR